MTIFVEHLRALAFNNAWADHRLLSACLTLSPEAFAAPRTGFFPSLRGTLNHNLIVDRFYISAMEGRAFDPNAFADLEPCSTAFALMAAQAEVDRRLILIARAARPHRVVLVHRADRVQRERLDRLLLHLFQHQTHHRGQAHGMLSATDIPPPQLDEFFCRDEKPLRAPDFAALGFTEADVWDDPGA